MKVHHVGYLVEDINSALNTFLNLGFEQQSKIVDDNLRGIDICFVKKDNLLTELICPNTQESSLFSVLKKKGAGAYHICYETADFAHAKEQLIKNGFMQITKEQPAKAINDNNVAFFFSKNMGIAEIVEVKNNG